MTISLVKNLCNLLDSTYYDCNFRPTLLTLYFPPPLFPPLRGAPFLSPTTGEEKEEEESFSFISPLNKFLGTQYASSAVVFSFIGLFSLFQFQMKQKSTRSISPLGPSLQKSAKESAHLKRAVKTYAARL